MLQLSPIHTASYNHATGYITFYTRLKLFLTTYVHKQFPGSDNLPWSGEEMMTALFSQTFSIGSLHPSMPSSSSMASSMTSSVGGATNQASVNEGAGRPSPPVPHSLPQRSDSPPPPKPISGPVPQKQHNFPETGGRSSANRERVD